MPERNDFNTQVMAEFHANGGKVGGPFAGADILILTSTGARTGQTRWHPVVYTRDGDRYVIVASKGGAPTNPVWVYNLRVNPDVEIRDETAVRPMRVREIEDEAERARLWKLAIAAYPPYAEYQERTARRIPIFVAEP